MMTFVRLAGLTFLGVVFAFSVFVLFSLVGR